ncbi:hypothetical protein PHET_02485 [Paragonimus heterotremus]|uniref:Uncharacterized protein n=1 Tax=Paragonimus heterotremus TaxID=100268 RepID=A0A8J4TD53_9TREM|nr:hypothetical protein PHET_02485 [Paragonimus heterotremus]
MAQLVQVCIIGDPKVGRSQLLLSFAQQMFGTYPRFDNVERDVEIYGQNVRIRVYDPSSHDDYRRTRMALYPNIEAILLCAALDDPVSLDNLTKKWMEELRSARVSKRPIILLLTKSDLLSEDAAPSQRKLIDSKAITQAARKLQVSDLFECSAKTGENVELAFKRAVELVVRTRDHGRKRICCFV